MFWIISTVISVIAFCIPYIFKLIGLSIVGPIAGSWFASMMGAGIAAGGILATMQSFVMSGWILIVQPCAIIFWIISSIVAFVINKNK
jgi:hypothetical protein